MSITPDAFDCADLATIDRLGAINPSKLYCPVCGLLAEKFRDGGTGDKKRKNAKCPKCGSLERHRLLWIHMVNSVWPALPAGKKDFLHVAPEPFFVEILKGRPDVNYLSGDLMMSKSMLKLDLTDIPFWEAQLDLILCSHILEQIPDDRVAMREMYRVLRPRGILLVMVPTYAEATYEDFSITSPEERRRHFGQEDHVRKYGWDIQDRLAECGFQVSAWPVAGSLDQRTTRLVAAGKRVIFTCRKPA
jgi:SAM-dependent methyltransferase